MGTFRFFFFKFRFLGCRKWGCNKWGLKGCLAALPANRPKSVFFALLKTEEKGLFPQISLDLLEPPYLKPPFAALQVLELETIRGNFVLQRCQERINGDLQRVI